MLKYSDMRKFSERFMKIPVRMYKSDDLEEYYSKDSVTRRGEEDELEYAIGYAKISPSSIEEWHDSFSRPRTIEDVQNDGFDCTTIKTKTGEDYNCVWKREKFEAKIDEFVDKFETEMEEEMNRQFDDRT